eukprot:CAMPEP_0194363390 /NCGR_PEP_ID=MMETSP0174-20130528/11184_1 /TAXON_ID=216777 /ORGANISM="Proboscia alata, Strain PI-D3" /LENGTH=288 /DNA_ID=CAMNT_0039136759 /DNA_START=62 /DNA_END=929 /DNA_ORIENTATION=+
MAGNVERGRYETLATSLVGTPNTLQSLTSEATAMIEVVAPADLPEGYEFEASVQSNNKDVSFTVKVPLGGVESGQRFSVPLASDNGQNNNSDDILAKAQHRIQVPVGDWRDGFFDVCRYGIFHSMACNALCCPQILVAQIMMRMNLTWRGDPAATVGQSAGTYKIILYTTMIYYLIKAPFQFWRMAHADEEEPDGEPTDGQVFNILFLYFWQFLFFNCFTTWIMTKTRSYGDRNMAFLQNIAKVVGKTAVVHFGAKYAPSAKWRDTQLTTILMQAHVAQKRVFPAMCL